MRYLACIQDQYYVRAYNADDTETIIVNQQTVASVNFPGDTGFISVTSRLHNGLNNFTFLDYNGPGAYSWGFQIQKNGQIIFSDMAGLVNAYGANNGDLSKPNQYVYSNTVQVNVTMCV